MGIGKNSGDTKISSPCKQNQMFCSFNHNQDITVRENTKLKSSLLPVRYKTWATMTYQ